MEAVKTYEYRIGNINFVFIETESGQLKLVHCSEERFAGLCKIPKELMTACSLVEVQITGLNQPDHKGNKLGNTLVGRDSVLREIHETAGKLVIIQEYKDNGINIEIITTIDAGFHKNVTRWKSKLTNKGKTIGVEYITSLNILGVNGSISSSSFSKDIIFLPNNAWQGEFQWQKGSLKEFGLNSGLDGDKLQDSTKILGVTNNTSWSCSQFSPFALLENQDKTLTSFWQLENNGEWHWELTDCGCGKGLALRAGGPTEPTNHWWKKLEQGESFETIPVAYGMVSGDFNKAIQVMNQYSERLMIRRII